MLDDRKSALWQALGLGPEWVLREELQELRKEQTKRDVPSPTLSPVPSKIEEEKAEGFGRKPSRLHVQQKLSNLRGRKLSLKLKIAISVISPNKEFVLFPEKGCRLRIWF